MLTDDAVVIILSFLPAQELLSLVTLNRRINHNISKFLYQRILSYIEQKDPNFTFNTILDMKAPTKFVLYYLQQHKIEKYYMEVLSIEGRLDVVQELFRQYKEELLKIDLSHAMVNACLGRHLSLVTFYHRNDVDLNDRCWVAAERNYPEIMTYLHENKCPFHYNVIAQAAFYGHIDVIEWLNDNEYITSSEDCEIAYARTNNKKIQELLLKIRDSLVEIGE